ncbi:uncharacterized protein LOC111009292 [Momordica charantia]|uniref:Uncharacterized protein LOC111009292 n=1 Tax=Momordica charantia TaxID=3673 RepID=A0A6J1C8I1_MOMCH|nr:uncharacterized protein LOC111009292 [Momordica charantia]
MEIKDQRLLKWPERMKALPSKRSKGRYCLFHLDHGHATQDCFDLKEEVEGLIRRGYLKEYMEDPKATQNGENDKQSTKIEFSKDEATHLLHPHNDALVITLKIANAKVHQILVDGGSSANIISLAAYKAMDLGVVLKSSTAPLVGFGGERVIPEGRIELSVTFGSGPKASLKW